jgi:hypothetical protein
MRRMQIVAILLSVALVLFLVALPRPAAAWERQNSLTAWVGADLTSRSDLIPHGGSFALALSRASDDNGSYGVHVGAIGGKPFAGFLVAPEVRLADARWFIPMDFTSAYVFDGGLGFLLQVQAGPALDFTVWRSFGVVAGYGFEIHDKPSATVHIFTLSLRGSLIWGY